MQKSIENAADREQQALATFQYEKHLQRLGVTPVRCVHTPKDDMQPYDAAVWIHGKWTTVLEIKTINYASEAPESSWWGKYSYPGLMLPVSQLTKLRKLFYRKSDITGKGYWKKEVVLLFRCVKDDVCYAIHIQDVAAIWNTLEDVDPSTIRSDHGKVNDGRTVAKLIPLDQMEKFT